MTVIRFYLYEQIYSFFLYDIMFGRNCILVFGFWFQGLGNFPDYSIFAVPMGH